MRRRGSGPLAVALALVAAATTWVSMLAWRGFTEETGRFLLPLALLAGLVAGSGLLLRWWRAPAPLVLLGQLVVSGLVAAAIISGSALPIGSGWAALRRAFEAAQLSAETYAPPVPAEAPGVHPYLIAGGLACLLLVDVLACTLRRAPLAGLPLLAVFSVPVGMLGISMTWWVFVITAVGYLLLLLLEQRERVWRWGRTLDGSSARVGGQGTAAATGAQAGLIGGGVTVLAVVLPLMIPTLGVHLLDIGRGPGGDDDISVVNPTTDLRRDLQRGADVPLLTLRTDDPDPSYLRIAVLTRFAGNEWSSGDRDIPTSQVARGQLLPPLQGVLSTVPRTSYSYRAEATDAFRSTWLPTMSQATSVTAAGDWRYDEGTTDFIAADDDLTTADLAWRFDAVDLDLDATTLDRAGTASGAVAETYLDLPGDVSPLVRNLANEVTRGADSPYAKARALQTWFRDSGNFTYSLDVDLRTSADDLATFLGTGPDGRTGYCEQFASAMAVMARELGLPARVAVGFLQPTRIGPGVWQYSSHDLHAWPEIFIPGGGWVRFEPTPPTRAATVPDYTRQDVAAPDPVTPGATEGTNPDEELPRDASSAAADTPDRTDDTADGADTAGDGVLLWPWLVAALGLLVLAGLAAAPGAVRRGRRDRRRLGGPEAVWAELRDTARDLGLPWPRSRSPRETAAVVASALGSGAGSAAGPGAGSGDALAALQRLVERVERSRFAPPSRSPIAVDQPSEPVDAELVDDLDAVLAAMSAAARPAARRRAALLPRSVFTRAGHADPAPDPTRGERLLEPV